MSWLPYRARGLAQVLSGLYDPSQNEEAGADKPTRPRLWRAKRTPTPSLIVLADDLWREAAPGALHVLTAELACDHPVIWVEAPVTQCLKAPGLRGRLRRSLRLDLPAVRYIDARREMDVATPPAVPPGNPIGDAMLAQTVNWLLRARQTSPRVLWIARRGPAGPALARRLRPAVTVDFHDDPRPGDRWCAEADLILWPAWAPLPEGERADDPRLMRLDDMGVRGALKLVPMIEGWLQPTLTLGDTHPNARAQSLGDRLAP